MLGGDQAQHNDLALGHEAQRGEVASTRRIIFEEEAIDLDFVKNYLGDWIVAALRQPRRRGIATAHMHAHRHVLGTARNRGVDEGGIGMHESLRLLVEIGAYLGPELRVAHVGEIDIVNLQIRASSLGKAVDLLAVEAREILIEHVEIRIGLRVDGLAATTKMHVGWGWNGLLGRDFGDGFQVREIIDEDAALWTRQPPNHTDTRRCEVDVALLGMESDLDTRLVYLGIPELGEEIHMPHLAAEFAIGRDLQAHVLLQLDGVAD